MHVRASAPQRVAVLFWLLLRAAACGPDEFPAFANPPPDDGGDASDLDDAGER
jgi:hypothetical protein